MLLFVGLFCYHICIMLHQLTLYVNFLLQSYSFNALQLVKVFILYRNAVYFIS